MSLSHCRTAECVWCPFLFSFLFIIRKTSYYEKLKEAYL